MSNWSEYFDILGESNSIPWDDSRYSIRAQMADIEEEIREFSKDTTGSRDTSGSAEELSKYQTPEEMNAYFKSLINHGSEASYLNEVKGSTAGEGMPIDRAFKHAMKYAASKGLNLGHAQKVRLKDWGRDNIANKNRSDLDGNKAIEAAINSKEAYR